MPGAVMETSRSGLTAGGNLSAAQQDRRTTPGPEKREPSSAAGDRRPGKYLSFLLAGEEFAIQVLKVREIMGMQEITAVPQTPQHLRGVINLRGKVIPVVDLRRKFRLPEVDHTQHTCIIVVQVEAGEVVLHTGILVDAVCEVRNLAADEIEDTPDFGEGGGSSGYLLGMAKVKGRVKILLDIDRALGCQEFRSLECLQAD